MIIFNYNNILQSYNNYIVYYAKKISMDKFEDYAQEIRIFIFEKLNGYKIEKSSLPFYIKMLIKTKYRRLIYDTKRQDIFEDSFVRIFENATVSKNLSCNYDQFISTIVTRLKTQNQISIFYAFLYNVDRKSYKEIAEFINISYSSFVGNIRRIKSVILEVAKEFKLL